jgi:hypothetical protein
MTFSVIIKKIKINIKILIMNKTKLIINKAIRITFKIKINRILISMMNFHNKPKLVTILILKKSQKVKSWS